MLTAKESLRRKRVGLENLQAQHAVIVAERARLKVLVSETLPPLRMGTMVGHHGKRAEQKLIQMVDSVAGVLEQVGIEKPFVDAVSAMFWLKPDDRGALSKKVLLYAEDALAEHLVTLDARLEDLGSKFAEEKTSQVEAEATATSAPKRHEACMEEFLAAEIALCEAEAALHKVEDVEKAKKHEVARRVPAMECAIQRLEAVQTHIAKFEGLRQRERRKASPSAVSADAKVSSEPCSAAAEALAHSAGA